MFTCTIGTKDQKAARVHIPRSRGIGLSLFLVLCVILICTESLFAQNVVAWGTGAGTNVPPDATNVIAVSAGLGFTIGLRSDGTVLAWGALDQISNNKTNVPSS